MGATYFYFEEKPRAELLFSTLAAHLSLWWRYRASLVLRLPVLRPSVSPLPTPTEDRPSVTSSQPSLKAAVDKGGDIKVTPDDSQHLSSSFRLLAAEFFSPSFLSLLFFFYFIYVAFSPFRPPSVFSRHPPDPCPSPSPSPSIRVEIITLVALIFLGAR